MPKRKAVVAAVALVACAGLGVAVYLRDQSGRAAMEALRRPPIRPPAGPLDPDGDAKPDPHVDVDAVNQQDYRVSLLIREMFRQAMLLAEHESGIDAPDRVLEMPGRYTPPGQWDVDVRIISYKGVFVRAAPAGRPWQTLATIPFPDCALDHVDLLARAERFSRGKFPALLRGGAPAPATAPATSTPATSTPADAPPDADVASIEARLGEMNLLSQFAAVRHAHELLRAHGERPEIVGLLIRGYANLGQQAQFLWSPAYEAFAARSLLYAQRMVLKDPSSPSAWQHRAYALAMAGLQGPATRDLNRARELRARASAPAGDPYWVPMTEAFCRYHTRKLVDAAAAPDAPPATASLATFLAFLTVEHCEGMTLVNQFGQLVLHRDPDCLRVADAMFEASGVSQNHGLSVYGPPAFIASLSTHLPQIPGLSPAAARALATLKRDPANLASHAALADAIEAPGGDAAAEPSARALAELVRDVQFRHATRRAEFLRYQLGVESADFVSAVRPLVANHRYARLMDAYTLPLSPRADQLASRLRGLVIVDPVRTMMSLAQRLGEAGLQPTARECPTPGIPYNDLVYCYFDHNSDQAERMLVRNWDARVQDQMAFWVRDLSFASPASPTYFARQIDADWPSAQPQVAAWIEQCGEHPTLVAALGRKYAELKDYPNAEKFLKLYLDKAPDYWAFDALAKVYLAQGDEAKWLSTLEGVLRQPDYALYHAWVHSQIAYHFFAKNEYAKAKPHAQAAADSYSSFGLVTAAACEEGLGNLDAAESWMRRNAERYGQEFTWYVWCRRTGHRAGDAAERALLAALGEGRGDMTGRQGLASHAVHHLLEGRPKDAVNVLSQSLGQYHDTWAGMYLAIAADAAGDAAGRDQLLGTIIDWAKEHPPRPPHIGETRQDPMTYWVRPSIASLADLYRSAAAAGRAPDRAAVDKICADAPTADHRGLCYFAGRIYELRGDREAALHYLKRAASVPDETANSVLAWTDLRRLGFDPASLYKSPTPLGLP